MSKSYLDLPERIKKSFIDIDSDIVTDLRASDAEYAELFKQVSKLKQSHPFIDQVLEGDGDISMTAEEHAAFVKCMSITKRMEDMERQHIYFRGHTDAFAYLKTIRAI